MKYWCHGCKCSEYEVLTERYRKYETARWRKIQVGECYLRTSSGQEHSDRLKDRIKRGYFGGHKRQDDH